MQDTIIKVESKRQILTIIAAAKAAGLKVHGDSELSYSQDFERFAKTYPYFGINSMNNSNLLVARKNQTNKGKVVSLGEFMTYLLEAGESIVTLNGSYTAYVTKDGIKVGQTMFAIKNVDDILKASLTKAGLANRDVVHVNETQARALSILGRELGYSMGARASEGNFVELEYMNGALNGSGLKNRTKADTITFDKFLEKLMNNQNKKVAISSTDNSVKYTAEIDIDKEVVNIGCQTFSLDVFTQMRAQYDKVTKK